MTASHVLRDSGTNDILDVTIKYALSQLFNEGSSHNLILTPENHLSAANVMLITKRDNINFNDLCSIDIFICIHGVCHCSEDSNTKPNFISNNITPVSKDYPLTIARVCCCRKCYCQLYQNFPKKRSTKNFERIYFH